MGLAELVLLAIGLSMDAFAVSICKGLGMKRINLKVAVILGLFFGGFQAGMPVIGWALGSQFMGIISPIDHWIAFILLAFIGGNMLWEAYELDLEKLLDYPVWYADYEELPQTPYRFSMWQYSSTGSVPGIEGNVDLNIQLLKK